jgi:hypothetical protein
MFPIEFGGRNDINNLLLLCAKCHSYWHQLIRPFWSSLINGKMQDMTTSHSSISAHRDAQDDRLMTLEVLKTHGKYTAGETINVSRSEAKRLLVQAKDTFRIVS